MKTKTVERCSAPGCERRAADPNCPVYLIPFCAEHLAGMRQWDYVKWNTTIPAFRPEACIHESEREHQEGLSRLRELTFVHREELLRLLREAPLVRVDGKVRQLSISVTQRDEDRVTMIGVSVPKPRPFGYLVLLMPPPAWLDGFDLAGEECELIEQAVAACDEFDMLESTTR